MSTRIALRITVVLHSLLSTGAPRRFREQNASNTNAAAKPPPGGRPPRLPPYGRDFVAHVEAVRKRSSFYPELLASPSGQFPAAFVYCGPDSMFRAKTDIRMRKLESKALLEAKVVSKIGGQRMRTPKIRARKALSRKGTSSNTVHSRCGQGRCEWIND